MKKEDLYEGFGALKDEVLKRSEDDGAMKKRNISKLVKIGSVAACLLVALGIGVFCLKDKLPKEDDTDNEAGQSVAMYPDVAPMVYVNGVLYKKSLEEVYYEEELEAFVYIGQIESDVMTGQTFTDGVPKEHLQANTSIVGSQVYAYGEAVVVKVNDIYWLYETESAGKGTVDWDSLSEQERMEMDPMYNAQ